LKEKKTKEDRKGKRLTSEIQLTQCPTWSQSLSGWEKTCIYLCQKHHHISPTVFRLPVTAPPDIARGIQWDSLFSCWWGDAGATKSHLGFSAGGIQCTWQEQRFTFVAC